MELPQELRNLVNKSVSLLGQVILRELGQEKYTFIENLRSSMAGARKASAASAFEKLQTHYANLKKLNPQERHEVAASFALMLEVMNACENAYRTHRLSSRGVLRDSAAVREPQTVIYVLTAHPTEARSPQNISIFHQIQILLTQVLDRQSGSEEISAFSVQESSDLLNLLEIAWRTSIVRSRAPKVKDEAEHIYSLLFRDNVLLKLIAKDDRLVSFFVRSWVGGDKDGHPGVNEKTLLASLTLSRHSLLRVMLLELTSVRRSLELFSSAELSRGVGDLEKQLRRLRVLKAGDAKAIEKYRSSFNKFKARYRELIGATHPSLRHLTLLRRTFPGLVVPLELRESSDMLMKPIAERPKLAIYKMLSAVEKIARGGDPRWYARGFIISMCEKIEHIQAAAWFQQKVFKALRLPVIPLFEEASSLADSDQIVTSFVNDTKLNRAAKQYWDGNIEIMVGYSDSSKEAGVLASRLAISKALPRLEKICQRADLTPVFFHGSGGSIDRGGGSIEDQTAWWPRSALRNYKVTVQGEMVERYFASPEIAKRQFENIVTNVSKGLSHASPENPSSPALDAFAAAISSHYRQAVTSPDFLQVIERATPYTYLSALKIGSRPSKRTSGLQVKNLRAIPWVLCWTQTRVLFPTWWGVGSAWRNSNPTERTALQKAFQNKPVFTSYIKALGFTLAKVELNIWRMYLTASGQESAFQQFVDEYDLACKAYLEICEQKEFMWFRPWLGESILLRSAMIHPLNLLQILAQQDGDMQLLRETVTGISSGMMTTG